MITPHIPTFTLLPVQALPAILKWGLAEDEGGALTAVPLPKALQRLDDVFDGIYSFSVGWHLVSAVHDLKPAPD